MKTYFEHDQHSNGHEQGRIQLCRLWQISIKRPVYHETEFAGTLICKMSSI